MRIQRLFGYFLEQVFKKKRCPKSERKDQYTVIHLNMKESPFNQWKNASPLS